MFFTFLIIFWVCILLVFYSYIGYGILLFLLVKIKRLFVKQRGFLDEYQPQITLMVAAYNEEAYIKEKMTKPLISSGNIQKSF